MRLGRRNSPSWPGLSRPSTIWLKEDVDARHKAGHDEGGDMNAWDDPRIARGMEKQFGERRARIAEKAMARKTPVETAKGQTIIRAAGHH